MKWFKHLTNSTSDPDLMEAELKYKANGTYVFWRVVEILAREDALDEPLIMNFKVFKSWFPVLSSPKLKAIIQFFCDKKRMAVEYINDDIKIFCEKLSVISSNYTKKVRREYEESTNSVRPKEVDVEVEKEVEKKKEKYKPITDCVFFDNDEFQAAWKSWNETRRKKKCSFSDRAIKQAVIKLMKLSSGDMGKAIKMLDHSAYKGYSDLYEIDKPKERKRYAIIKTKS